MAVETDVEFLESDLISSLRSQEGFVQLYEALDAESFPTGNYYFHKHHKIPNVITHNKSKIGIVDKIMKEGFISIWKHHSKVNISYEMLENDDVLLYLNYEFENNDNTKKMKCSKVFINVFYGDIESNVMKKLLKLLDKFNIPDDTKNKKGNISLILQDRNGLKTVEYDITAPVIDIGLQYGKNFIPVYDKILKRLEENKGKGIVLLHGIPGSGKTFLLRHLVSSIDKQILFFPPHMAEQIASPEFIPFLINNRNSIIVIEDAEKVVLSRNSGESSSSGVSNILNLTDGLLSDCLGIQVVATFNTERDKIDSALLRKGRLIAEWKFDALPTEDANKLLKHLGKEYKATEPMTLTDIYNVEEEVHKNNKQKAVIGFNKY